MNLQPTFVGYVANTKDALVLFQAAISGTKAAVTRRPHDREKVDVIRSGNIFIFNEQASGIKRWTDGVAWSPSRIKGNFLLYRELENSVGSNEKKKTVRKPSSTSSNNRRRSSSQVSSFPSSSSSSRYSGTGPYLRPSPRERYPSVKQEVVASVANPAVIGSDQSSTDQDMDLQHPRYSEDSMGEGVMKELVGSLVDSYGFKQNGLVKKTISIQAFGIQHHLVSYYSPQDIIDGRFITPSQDPDLQRITLDKEIYEGQHFRIPWKEEEEQQHHAHGHGARLDSTFYPPIDITAAGESYSTSDAANWARTASRYSNYHLIPGPGTSADLEIGEYDMADNSAIPSTASAYDIPPQSTHSLSNYINSMRLTTGGGISPGAGGGGAGYSLQGQGHGFYSGYRPFTGGGMSGSGSVVAPSQASYFNGYGPLGSSSDYTIPGYGSAVPAVNTAATAAAAVVGYSYHNQSVSSASTGPGSSGGQHQPHSAVPSRLPSHHHHQDDPQQSQSQTNQTATAPGLEIGGGSTTTVPSASGIAIIGGTEAPSTFSPSLPPLSQSSGFYQTVPQDYQSIHSSSSSSSDPRKLPDGDRAGSEARNAAAKEESPYSSNQLPENPSGRPNSITGNPAFSSNIYGELLTSGRGGGAFDQPLPNQQPNSHSGSTQYGYML